MYQLKILLKRWRKQRPEQWLNRKERAYAKCWQILQGPATIQKFHRFERHHNAITKALPQKFKNPLTKLWT